MSFHRLRGPLGAAALALCAHQASAHAVLERREAEPDSFYRAVVQITHGCGASPTTSVRVTVPDGAVGARPMAKPGWTVETVKGAYGRTYPFVHGSLSEGVKEIAWSGNTLPADQFDEFVFSVRLSGDFKPGATVYFPAVQTCAAGVHRWVEIPAPGQDPHALSEPAPSVRIVAARVAAASDPDGTVKVGDLTIERPWMRATPNGAKVAGGYLRVTNTGREPDRLLSTSIPQAGAGQVHEMSTANGVMTMRQVEGGLEIKPGQSVELKPGGFHLMFMDLTSGLKEGQAVEGSLTFARAGTVRVLFSVAGLGAREPGSGHSHP